MVVVEWLLDSDPAIRWQVMRDLTDAPVEEVAAERARIATEGWGARLLALQREDGHWEGGTPTFKSEAAESGGSRCRHKARHALPRMDLDGMEPDAAAAFGLDPASAEARRAVRLVREHVQWEHDGEPFFAGEVEPCINGKVVALGAYFGENVHHIVDRLLGEQMSDGGWNCEQENGATVGSFHSTIDVLDGLLEYERATGEPPGVSAARLRGQEYLLNGGCCAGCRPVKLSTGLHAVLLPDLLALRRPPRTRLPARGRCRSGRADGRGDRAGRVQARCGGPLATRKSPSRPDALRDGRGRGQTKPLEHAPGDARAQVVPGSLVRDAAAAAGARAAQHLEP